MSHFWTMLSAQALDTVTCLVALRTLIYLQYLETLLWLHWYEVLGVGTHFFVGPLQNLRMSIGFDLSGVARVGTHFFAHPSRYLWTSF